MKLRFLTFFTRRNQWIKNLFVSYNCIYNDYGKNETIVLRYNFHNVLCTCVNF